MAAAVIPMMVAATAMQAYSSYESGRQAKKAAQVNADLATQQAQISRDTAKAKAEIYSKQAASKMATIRQQYSKAGVEISEGSPLTVLMESASEAAKDVVRIKAGGEQEAWGFLSEAQIQKTAGESAYTQGLFGAGASLLGGSARATAMSYGATPTSWKYGNESAYKTRIK